MEDAEFLAALQLAHPDATSSAAMRGAALALHRQEGWTVTRCVRVCKAIAAYRSAGVYTEARWHECAGRQGFGQLRSALIFSVLQQLFTASGLTQRPARILSAPQPDAAPCAFQPARILSAPQPGAAPYVRKPKTRKPRPPRTIAQLAQPFAALAPLRDKILAQVKAHSAAPAQAPLALPAPAQGLPSSEEGGQ